MTNSQFTKKIKAACKHCSINSKSWLHFGRKTAPALMDLEEVGEMDKRALGNWATDVFGECYSSKLPLAAMRVMAGFEKETGLHYNPRTTFYGEEKHQELAKMIFPWIEEVEKSCNLEERHSARGFLNYLLNLRWVIIQDCAVMIGINKRKHFIFEKMNHIFGTDLFKDYMEKMIVHLNASKNDDPNAARIDLLLPGVNAKMMQGINATKACHTEISQTNKTILAKLGIMLDNHDNLATNIESTIKHNLGKAISHIGKCMVDYDPGSVAVNTGDEIQIEESTTQTVNHSSTEIVTDVIGIDTDYTVPKDFASVECMREHWDTKVDDHEKRNGSKWRKHLSTAERKRFTRLKRVVIAFKMELLTSRNQYATIEEFESFYSSHDKSLAKLADVYVKQLNN